MFRKDDHILWQILALKKIYQSVIQTWYTYIYIYIPIDANGYNHINIIATSGNTNFLNAITEMMQSIQHSLAIPIFK
jgi:hypothetical protein